MTHVESEFSPFAQRLARIRGKRTDLSWFKSFGASRSAYYDWEKDKGAPKVKVLISMQEVLKIDLYELLTGKTLALEPVDAELLARVIEEIEAMELSAAMQPGDKAKIIARDYLREREAAADRALVEAMRREGEAVSSNGQTTHSKPG